MNILFEHHAGNKFLGIILTETVRAVFFQDWFWEQPQWVPKSQIEFYEGKWEVSLMASDWICKQNGWEEFKK